MTMSRLSKPRLPTGKPTNNGEYTIFLPCDSNAEYCAPLPFACAPGSQRLTRRRWNAQSRTLACRLSKRSLSVVFGRTTYSVVVARSAHRHLARTTPHFAKSTPVSPTPSLANNRESCFLDCHHPLCRPTQGRVRNLAQFGHDGRLHSAPSSWSRPLD